MPDVVKLENTEINEPRAGKRSHPSTKEMNIREIKAQITLNAIATDAIGGSSLPT